MKKNLIGPAALVAVLALLVTPTYLAKFDMGDSIGQKAFFAAIIGGFNQTRGALLGGLLIGIVESLGGLFLGESLGQIGIFAIFIAVLLFRLQGLLGARP